MLKRDPKWTSHQNKYPCQLWLHVITVGHEEHFPSKHYQDNPQCCFSSGVLNGHRFWCFVPQVNDLPPVWKWLGNRRRGTLTTWIMIYLSHFLDNFYLENGFSNKQGSVAIQNISPNPYQTQISRHNLLQNDLVTKIGVTDKRVFLRFELTLSFRWISSTSKRSQVPRNFISIHINLHYAYSLPKFENFLPDLFSFCTD